MIEKNILNTDSFVTGAFILNTLQQQYSPFDGKNQLFLTQHQDDGLKKELIKLITETTTVLKVCSFILTDKEIFEVLLDKAQSGDIAIFVLTQLDPSKLLNSILLTEEENKEQSQNIHLSYIKTLYDNGVHVRASTTAHAKFIVADRKKGFMMSANLTTPSLTYNTESGIYLNKECVNKLDGLFDVIFQKGTSYRQYLNAGKKNKQLVIQNESNVRPEWFPKTNESALRYTYDQVENNLLNEIISIMSQAKEYLFLSSYSIVALQYIPQVKEGIKLAIERGVKISVFCRGMNYRIDHLRGCNELSELGCSIYGDIYNHSKAILNETTGLIFTANIDGNHGLINGFEVGSLLNEEQHTFLLEFHKHLIKTSPFIFKKAPNRIELFAMYESLEKSKSINPPKFDESITLLVKKGLYFKQEELEGQPIFYARSKDTIQEHFLIAGNSCFKVAYKEGVFHINEMTKASFNMDKFILRYKNLKIKYNNEN